VQAVVIDGSRAGSSGGYKNSLHLVFPSSPTIPAPTSASAAPDYPPLVAGKLVHSSLPEIRDGKVRAQESPGPLRP
jgi:hypothetical protein